MAAPNSNSKKHSFKLEIPKGQAKQVKNYLVRLYINTDHVRRWLTPALLQNFGVLHVTQRQMEHVIMWTKKALNINIGASALEIEVPAEKKVQ